MGADLLEESGEKLDVDEKVLDSTAHALNCGELPSHQEINVEIVVTTQ